MKNNRLNQFLFALILSLGILFCHTSMVLAEETEPAVENENQENETPDAVPAPVLELEQVQGDPDVDPQAVIDQAQGYLSEGFDQYIDETDDSTNLLETEGAIVEAAAAEMGTMVVVQPIDDEEVKDQILENEGSAVGYDDDADAHLATAVEEGVKAEVEIAKEGVEITKEVIGTGVDLIQTEIAVGQASDANDDAQQNLIEAQEADTRAEAQAAANEAQENANKAKEAAQAALANANEAIAKAQNAADAYERAVIIYNETRETIKEELAAGLISLQEAETRTIAAEEVAREYYERMVQAQAEAEAFTQSAKEASEEADAELIASVEELAKVVADNAKNIAGKTAIATATGAAYEAAIIAEDFVKKPVDQLNDSIEEVQERIDAMTARVDAAKNAYDQAVAALKGIKDKDEYIAAAAELDAAYEAMIIADNALAEAEMALDEMKHADYAKRMLELQSLLNTGISGDDLLAVEKELTEIIFQNNNEYSKEDREKITFDWTSESLVDQYGNVLEFTDLDTEGSYHVYFGVTDPSSTKNWYQMTLVPLLENDEQKKVLNYSPITVKYDAVEYDISVQEELEKIETVSIWSYKYGKTPFEAIDQETGDSYSVYAIHRDKGWFVPAINIYFVNTLGTFDIIEIIDSGKASLDEIREEYGLIDRTTAKLALLADTINSNAITNHWKAAEANVEALRVKAQEAEDRHTRAELAVEELIGDAEEAVSETKKALDDLIAERDDIEKEKQALIDQRDGDAINILVRVAVKYGNPDDIPGELATLAYLRWLDSIGALTDETAIARLKELNEKYENIDLSKIDIGEITDLYSNVTKVIEAIKEGKIDEETIEAIKALLDDISFAPQTKLTIATTVKDYLGDLHVKAVHDLEDAVEAGKQSIKENTDIVEENLYVAAICKAVYAAAKKAELEAKAKAIYAKVVYEAAKLAHRKATEAVNTYRSFMENFDPNDGLLNLLSKEMSAGTMLAFKALFDAKDAEKYANQAQAAADEAKRIAEETFYDVWVSGIQVNERNKENVLGNENVSVKFDNDTNTLYLDNAEINVKKVIGGIEEELDIAAGIYSEVDNLNIIVNGVNSIIAKKKLIFNEYDTVAGIYAVDKNGENANLKLLGTLTKNAKLSIDLTNFKADDFAVGIKGDVTIRDFDSLIIKTSDVTMNANIDASLLNDQYPYSRPQEFFAPASVGINGAVTIDNSNVELLVGKGTLNYGIAAFLKKDIEILNKSYLFIELADVSDSSTGISAMSLNVEDSSLTVTSGNATKGNKSTTSSAIDPVIITIKDSIVEATSGDASNSFAFFTPGAYDIMFETSEGVKYSRIRATAGRGSEGNNIAILGNINAIGNGTLIAEAIEGDYGIGLAGFLSATDDSVISLKGSKQAIYYPDEKFKPDVGTRSIFVSDSTKDEETLVLWKGGDLRSEDIRWITLGIKEKSDYDVIDGDGTTWTEGTTTPLSVEIANNDTTSGAEDPFDHFVTAFVDDKELRKDVDYTIRHGSVIIDLKPSYLNKLSAGWHTLKAVFNNSDDVTSRFNIVKKSSGGGSSSSDSKSSSSSTKQSSSVVTCQMAGYPNGYAWNEAAKACQPGYIDNNGVFHSYKTSGRYNTPNTADEGINPFYLLFLSLISTGALGYVFCKEN